LHGLQAAAQGLHGLQAAAQGLQGLHAAAQGLHGLHAAAAQGLQGLHWASWMEVSAALAVATGKAAALVARVATLRATSVSLSIKSSRLEKTDRRRRHAQSCPTADEG
jgi:hypothetical protein